MNLALTTNFVPVLLSAALPKNAIEKGEQAKKTHVNADQFLANNDEQVDLIKLAKKEIDELALKVPKKGLTSLFPQRTLRKGTKAHIEHQGKKYTIKYDGKNFKGEVQLKAGDDIKIFRLQVPIRITIVEPDTDGFDWDITCDGQPDILHGRLIENLISSRMKKKGLAYQIKIADSWDAETDKNLLLHAGENPDLIIAPVYNASNIPASKLSKEQYEEDSKAFREQELHIAKLYESYQQQSKEHGTLVLAIGGNHPNAVSPYLPGEGIIGLGALDEDGETSHYSAKNDFIDIQALGEFKIKTLFDSNDKLIGFDFNDDNKLDLKVDDKSINPNTASNTSLANFVSRAETYTIWTGTSFAPTLPAVYIAESGMFLDEKSSEEKLSELVKQFPLATNP